MSLDVRPYDALLLVSFGGPEKHDDVIPFLQNVTAGKSIGTARLREVAKHYDDFGGRSPINEQCRELLEAIGTDFAAAGIDLPVYWGNRNWDPYLPDTLARMAQDGVTRAACFLTSAYASYSGCRQYREDLFAAAQDTGVELDRLRHYFNHPGFITPFVDSSLTVLRSRPAGTRVIFVTHSIPESMNDASGGPGARAYERQHRDVAAEVAVRIEHQLGHHVPWSLAFCSRSGPAAVPWLEPDINDELESSAADDVTSVVVVPIGFVSDHMEVIYDLDTEAAQTAARLGIEFARVPTPGVDRRFVAMIRDLLVERAGFESGATTKRCAVGGLAAGADRCSADCCESPYDQRPAIGCQ